MKFEDVKNVKVGDKLKVVDSILCSNLNYETNRGNIEKDDTIILTVTENDKRGYKPFLCSINVNGKDKGVKWWISYEAVEVIGEQQSVVKKPNLKSGDKVVRTGNSIPDLSMINGEIYTVNHVYFPQGECILTLEECYNDNYHYTFNADQFQLLDVKVSADDVSLDTRNGGEIYPASEILDENITVGADNRATPSGGGSASYYKKEIPKGLLEKWNEKGAIETSEVIRLFLGNDFTHGNIFKASCRIIGSRNGGGKKGVSEEYDLDKQVYFAEDDAAWNELFK